MDESIESATEPANEDSPRFFNRLLKVAAYPVAGLSGLWVAARDVHYAAHERARSSKGNPLMIDIERHYDRKFVQNGQELKSNRITGEQWLAKDLDIRHHYVADTDKVMDKLGLGNKWFSLKELPTKWSYVPRSKRSESIIKGLTVSGVAIGAILTITNSRTLIDFFSRHHKGNERER